MFDYQDLIKWFIFGAVFGVGADILLALLGAVIGWLISFVCRALDI